jgi:hypothetical protein
MTFNEYLASKGHKLPPFDPSETSLSLSLANAWARHPDTDLWWFLPLERPGRDWIESLRTESKYDLPR